MGSMHTISQDRDIDVSNRCVYWFKDATFLFPQIIVILLIISRSNLLI